MFSLKLDQINDLNTLKAKLSPKLVLNANPLDVRSLDQIVNHQFVNELIELVLLKIDEDDAGVNVVKVIDHCFAKRPLLAQLYPKLSSSKSKYILIDYLTEKFKDKELGIKHDDLNYLIELFKKCLNKLSNEDSQLDRVELVKLSDLMCLLSSTSNCDYDRSLINKDLIKLITETLNYCHSIGKQANLNSENPFAIISKLSQVNNPESLSKETFFSFKSNLIGLLGNFSHSNKDVQDWVREFDAIALILDCTNIDARNPFIIQWSVFALKNILSNNKANQEFVRNVSKQNGPLKFDLSQIM